MKDLLERERESWEAGKEGEGQRKRKSEEEGEMEMDRGRYARQARRVGTVERDGEREREGGERGRERGEREREREGEGGKREGENERERERTRENKRERDNEEKWRASEQLKGNKIKASEPLIYYVRNQEGMKWETWKAGVVSKNLYYQSICSII